MSQLADVNIPSSVGMFSLPLFSCNMYSFSVNLYCASVCVCDCRMSAVSFQLFRDVLLCYIFVTYLLVGKFMSVIFCILFLYLILHTHLV